MKPVVVEFTPTEALHIHGIMSALALQREKKGLSSGLDRRIAAKVDRAVLEATELDEDERAEHLHLGPRT